ncbi:MAG: hypothetical protein AAF416_13075 [Pseudomonadota bacterium]
MSTGSAEEPSEPAQSPVALLALTVAGKCRERSPVDLALFGPNADSFVDRFLDAASGQALFTRAVQQGAAEGVLRLKTQGGPLLCRVSLWRQRGGDRIRLVAAIAPESGADPTLDDAGSSEVSCDSEAGSSTAEHTDLGTLLRRPAEAVLGLLDGLRPGRKGGPKNALVAEDAMAAMWRLIGLARAVTAQSTSGAIPGAGAAPSEVDLGLLAGRLARLAAPGAARSGIAVTSETTPEARDCLAVADGQSLWSAVEAMIAAAVAAAGPRGAVRATVDRDQAGRVALTVIAALSDDSTTDHSEEAALPLLQEAEGFAEAAGCTLSTEERASGGLHACLAFAPEATLSRS